MAPRRRVGAPHRAAAAALAFAAAAWGLAPSPAAAQRDALAAELLGRLDAYQAEIRRLTAQVETLEQRLRQAESESAARLTDLEMRLIELEGGDPMAALSNPPPGGAVQPPQPPVTTAPPPAPLGTLRVEAPDAEQRAAFDAAAADLARGGVDLGALSLGAFVGRYPDSPLAAQAHHLLGSALETEGRHQEAARQFLAGFRDHPGAPFAPNNLLGLGTSLVALGRFEEACGTLAELRLRYPGAPAGVLARADRAAEQASCR